VYSIARQITIPVRAIGAFVELVRRASPHSIGAITRRMGFACIKLVYRSRAKITKLVSLTTTREVSDDGSSLDPSGGPAERGNTRPALDQST
jgi:hypothetical protein